MGSGKKQKRARKKAARNRYCAGAKLSEHKFLRLLRGFADNIPVQALAQTTHVSGKTIRATYARFRQVLPEATQSLPLAFGRAGLVLWCEGELAPDGEMFLRALAQSRQYRRHKRRHAPRLRSPLEERLIVIEFAVRIFCALDLGRVDLPQCEDAVLAALTQGIAQLSPRDPLSKVCEYVPGVRAHHHPHDRLYEDVRRYLLKHPL